ncbi:MAG TPA: alkaline phosphatase family protein, partial [Chloroflexota bacterium]|nr:alkaline phosphatase family protein [Chloroflexota bacterium]
MVLVIGLDGATYDLLTPWLAAGHLPTMAGLVARGSSGPLRSTLPPVTAPAWASFMTGKNPAGHGVFDFFRPHSPDMDKPEMVNMADLRARPLWDYLSAAGRRVGVLNVPLTYPPPPVNGFVVPGLLSPDEGQTTYPPD